MICIFHYNDNSAALPIFEEAEPHLAGKSGT